MHFGATVREILSASCGEDLRDASARTRLPALTSAATRKTLAANLELAFGIDLAPRDLAQLHTVRDVLQCVRLHRWEGRVTGTTAPRSEPARPVFVTPTRDPRERLFRLTRRPLPASPSVTAPLAPRRSSKRV